MSMTPPLLPLALAALALPCQPQVSPVEESAVILLLSLDDALRIALENDLELATQVLDTEIAALNARGAWGAFDPVLSVTGTLRDSEIQGQSSLAGADVVQENSQRLNGSLLLPFKTGGAFLLEYGRVNDSTNNVFATFDVYTRDVVTLSLNQPLLQGGWRRYATLDQEDNELTYRVADQSEAVLRQLLLLDVANAYWDLVRAQAELEVRQRARALGDRALAQEERRLEVGAGTEVDVLQAKTNLAQRDEEILRARFDRAAAEDALRQRLFQRGDEDREAYLERWESRIEPTTELPEPAEREAPGDWRVALARAFEERPALVAARLEIERAELAIDRSRSGRLPRVDLDLSASSAGFDREPEGAFEIATSYDFPTYQGSLTFEMPIFNRIGRYGLRSARVAARKARLAYEQAELAILAEVRAAVRDVVYGAQKLAAAEASRALAERQLAAEESRRENGLSTTFQVLEFQQTLAEALSTEKMAAVDYAKALAGLAHAKGEIDDWAAARAR
ncbi:MAG: TolC family protein [Planctomycetota bacterium]